MYWELKRKLIDVWLLHCNIVAEELIQSRMDELWDQLTSEIDLII